MCCAPGWQDDKMRPSYLHIQRSIKFPAAFYSLRNRKTDAQIHMELHGALKRQSNPEKEE